MAAWCRCKRCTSRTAAPVSAGAANDGKGRGDVLAARSYRAADDAEPGYLGYLGEDAYVVQGGLDDAEWTKGEMPKLKDGAEKWAIGIVET